jgi:hypothetical protein
MLEAVLRRAELKPHEREMYEDIWDKLHRYGRITHNQGSVIEKVYYGQKLDGSGPKPQATPQKRPPTKDVRGPVAVVMYKGLEKEVCVTTMDQLAQVCPDIRPGSKQHAKIAEFFRKGGRAVTVKPAQA